MSNTTQKTKRGRGRPPLNPPVDGVPIDASSRNIRVSDKDWAILVRLGPKLGSSAAGLARRAISEFLASRRKPRRSVQSTPAADAAATLSV